MTPRIDERQVEQQRPVGAARTRLHSAVGSLHDLACAAEHLRHDTPPGSDRSFHVYNRAGPDLLEELEDLLRKSAPSAVWVKKAGGGQFASSPERHEVEAVVQLAAHRTGVACELKNAEQLRSAAGAAKGKGAYDSLLARDDVAARPSKDKRERYLYAHSALRSSGG